MWPLSSHKSSSISPEDISQGLRCIARPQLGGGASKTHVSYEAASQNSCRGGGPETPVMTAGTREQFIIYFRADTPTRDENFIVALHECGARIPAWRRGWKGISSQARQLKRTTEICDSLRRESKVMNYKSTESNQQE